MSAPNWLGLLKWSLAVGDGTAPSDVHAMSPEDVAWLETVMKEGVRDDPHRMNEVMTKVAGLLDGSLALADEQDHDIFLDDLEELRDIVEQIDLAEVFSRLGGSVLVLRMALDTKWPDNIRTVCFGALGTVSQNNLVVQQQYFDRGITQQLGQAVLRPENFSCMKKLLFSLSCSIRGHALAEESFVLQDLPRVWPALLATPSVTPVVLGKLCFLVNALLVSDSCSDHRLSVLVQTMCASSPSTLSLLLLRLSEEGSDVESREFVLQLLISMLQSEEGARLLHAVAAEVAAVVQRWEASMEEDEAVGRFNELVGDLRRRLSSPPEIRYPALHQSQQLHSRGDQDEQSTEILLLEPPQLEASSRVP